ncbi:MAG: mannose-1-phosphate guanylyltransferase/mannose-6-phosphate isomerase [Endozoicomonas sp.]
MISLIVSGGSGIRLWPLSRQNCPKQFIPLQSGLSMFQQTLLRLENLTVKQPTIVCNKRHRFLMAEQCRQAGITPDTVLLEPVGRNTAPAVTLMALSLLEQGCQEPLLVLPADHQMTDTGSFLNAVKEAEKFADQGYLVTFGVIPDYPETSYGYIRRGSELEGAFSVDAFMEKPGLQKAQNFVSDERYYWNSGMYLFRPEDFLDELWRYRPKMVNACHEALKRLREVDGMLELDETAFRTCPSESIDCAVMENTRRGVVVPLDAGWTDLGSWSSFTETIEKDEYGNRVMGDVVLKKCTNTSIFSSKRLVTALDVSNLLLVETDDAILLTSKKNPDVKSLVETLWQDGRTELEAGTTEYTGWGSSTLVTEGCGFRIRRLKVNPGSTLGPHKHIYRTENWTVIKGIADIDVGGSRQELAAGESVAVPAGVLHKLSNPGQASLELIEIQTGSILSEEDCSKN